MKRHFLYWLTCVADLVSGFIGTITFALYHPSDMQMWAQCRYLDECERPFRGENEPTWMSSAQAERTEEDE